MSPETITILATVGCFILSFALVWAGAIIENDGWAVVLWGIAALVALAGIAGIIISIAYPASLAQSMETCRHWGQANGRPTKFVRYTYWTWDCLTPNFLHPHTWISTHNATLLGQ